MPQYTEKIGNFNLPVLPLHDAVAFPQIPIDFETDDAAAIAAIEAAKETDMTVLLVVICDDNGTAPAPADLCSVGTVAKIRSSVKDGDTYRVICECKERATVTEYYSNGDAISATGLTKTVTAVDNGGIKGEAYRLAILQGLEQIVSFLTVPTSGIRLAAKSIKDPALLSDFVASAALVRAEDKQKVLEEFDPLVRCALLLSVIDSECKILETERLIREKAGTAMARNQRDYFLREEMKAIQEELGEDKDPDDLSDRIAQADLPDELRAKLMSENDRIMRSPYGSAEAAVGRNYIEEVLSLPWNKKTKDRLDIEYASKILERDHDGLEKIKERILEYIAVRQLNPSLGNQIICLVGPPGTGKTSVAESIAHAMNRKFVRVSLGGVHDEADIRGHRKTYVAAMPGRIINGIKLAGVSNPVMLLDELDKLANDSRGDPSSAMLEVLDPAQNKSFRDHFIEYPFDLSDCFFITTANTLSTVPRPLIDRMEVIELEGYTRSEKFSIAENHLLPKQMKNHGLTKRSLKIEPDAIYGIIDFYTREAGVRNLERNISALCRKAARKIVESDGTKKSVKITLKDLNSYLGSRKVLPEKISRTDLVGVVNGLAYTEAGGDLLPVECSVLEGSGKLELTGSLGEVMKESARTAVTFVRSVAAQYGIPEDFYKTKDIHLHFPEGAVPKDGPSAGVTIVTALISALSGLPVRRTIAMTGEVTITGRVLAIGGLREKTMAAFTAGVKTVIIPEENVCDLDELDKEVRAGLTFIPVSKAIDVLSNALIFPADYKVSTEKAAPEAEIPAVAEARGNLATNATV